MAALLPTQLDDLQHAQELSVLIEQPALVG
jgi:hypothetical protein